LTIPILPWPKIYHDAEHEGFNGPGPEPREWHLLLHGESDPLKSSRKISKTMVFEKHIQ